MPTSTDPYGLFQLFPGASDAENQALGTGFNARNEAVKRLLGEYNGPSYENVFASGGKDSLAQGFRTSGQAVNAQLAARGLTDSGAAIASRRGLQKQYSTGILSNTEQAAQLEYQRKQQLLADMMGISAKDLEVLSGLAGAQVGSFQTNSNDSLAKLTSTLGYGSAAVEAAKLAALAYGAYAGAGGTGLGASKLSGLGGGQTGLPGAANAVGKLSPFLGGGGGAGGGNYFSTQPTQTPRPTSVGPGGGPQYNPQYSIGKEYINQLYPNIFGGSLLGETH